MIKNGNIDILIKNRANDENILEPDYNEINGDTVVFEDVVGNEYGDFRVITTVHSSNKNVPKELYNFTDYSTMKVLADMGLRAGLFVIDGITYNVFVLGSSKDDKLNREWAKSVSI